jgi:hypothetical protein
VKDAILTGFQHERSDTTRIRHALPLELCAVLYARMALGAAFLSAVADRFGLWGKYGGWGNFANFEHPRQRSCLPPASQDEIRCEKWTPGTRTTNLDNRTLAVSKLTWSRST